MSTATTGLTLREIRRAFRGRRGEVSRLAEALGKHRNSIHDVLAGRMKSREIRDACEKRAMEILDQERAHA